MKFAPTRKLFKLDFPRKSSIEPVLHRHRHSLCALSSEGHSHVYIEEEQHPPGDVLFSTTEPPVTRTPWDIRLNNLTPRKWPTRTRVPFSTQRDAYKKYLPYVQELLKGLWSLDKNPIWLLVDDVVATGEFNGIQDEYTELSRWMHIVEAPHYFDATSTLVAQGHLRYRSPVEELDRQNLESEESDEVDEGSVGDPEITTTASAVPTWLVAFILATMVNTRGAAYEGVAFCLSQLDGVPRRTRASLLLLSMCAVSTHGVAVLVPVLLDAFHDILSQSQMNHESSEDATHSLQSLGPKEAVIYQFNVLLTLLSQFPHVPGFSHRTIQLLHHMEACGVTLDDDTAKQLVTARFASELLVRTVSDVLERQSVRNLAEPSDDLSAALLRFYSKKTNQNKAARHAEVSFRVHPGHHAKAYLRSFRDVAGSLAYQRTVEAGASKSTTQGTSIADEGVSNVGPQIAAQDRMRSPTPTTAISLGVPKRHIYTSLLYSAALSKSISATTFRNLFITIRETHGDDRVLETVALSGMLRRKAWDEAKDIWAQWQTTNRSIQSMLHEMRRFLHKRERVFRDSTKVRRTLGWTKLTEFVTMRRMRKLRVDASALAVIVRALAGPKPDSLTEAFMTMDRYALKWTVNPEPSRTLTNPRMFQPTATSVRHASTSDFSDKIRLTSCVINCFMVRAMYFRRPDIIFRLWDGMTSHYGVDSSVATLGIVLRSARLAASMETALSKLIPKWMMSSHSILREGMEFPDLSARIFWMLSPACSPDMRWDGAPPWRVARHIYREEIIFANWPHLRHVVIPARAVRGDDATGRIEALKELRMDQGLWGTKIRKMGRYPHIVPSARTFREYIIMLGRVHRSSEIPEVLAWMRALDISPPRQLLGISLALWSQVGLDSLVDDVWDGTKSSSSHHSILPGQPRHGGEYGKLLAWLEDWVGEKNVPGESEVLESFRYLQELEQKEAVLY